MPVRRRREAPDRAVEPTEQPSSAATEDVLDLFRPSTRAWFRSTFAEPTPAQVDGWRAISAGHHTLIHAPTGSGKTLAAFLWCLDRLTGEPPALGADGKPKPGVRVLYVSPLKALTYDVERNLRAPLAGIALAAARLNEPIAQVTVGSRTGDTSSEERRQLARRPPDILITTPESLYLILTSQAREMLRTVEHVIVDEVHAIAGGKRGAHLALSLERLERLTPRSPQRIGLSATQRPLETIARFLGGVGEGRAVQVVDAGARKPLELQVVVPVEDLSRLGEVLPLEEQPGGPAAGPEARVSIWPAVYPRLLELVRAHRSTLIFVNNRRLAERIAARLNELAGEELVRAHHGSIAREQRHEIEERLKAGLLPGLVCTSSLELGIDMGAVDLVVRWSRRSPSPAACQRVGRAGPRSMPPAPAASFPSTVATCSRCGRARERMHEGLDRDAPRCRATRSTCWPNRSWPCASAMTSPSRRSKRSSAAPTTSPRSAVTFFESVLGMLAGQYPSDEFADLKPRIIWDRTTDIVVVARGDARVVAITSGGTIPERGLYGVFLGEGGPRVGELDEEMVYESRR